MTPLDLLILISAQTHNSSSRSSVRHEKLRTLFKKGHHWRAPNISAANSRRSKNDLIYLNSTKKIYAAASRDGHKIERYHYMSYFSDLLSEGYQRPFEDRTRTNTNPSGTETSAEGRSGRACVARKFRRDKSGGPQCPFQNKLAPARAYYVAWLANVFPASPWPAECRVPYTINRGPR
jgi:hypothetical protein